MKLWQKQLKEGRKESDTCMNDHQVEYIRLPEEIVVYSRHPEFDPVGYGIEVSIGLSVQSIQELFETLSLTGLNDLKDVTPARLLQVWEQGLAEVHTSINEHFTGLIFRNFMGKLLVKEDVEGASWEEAEDISPDPYHLLLFTQRRLERVKGLLATV